MMAVDKELLNLDLCTQKPELKIFRATEMNSEWSRDKDWSKGYGTLDWSKRIKGSHIFPREKNPVKIVKRSPFT